MLFISLRLVIFIFVVIALSNSIFLLSSYAQSNTLYLTHGIASGDVTDNSAIIWARANKEAQMNVEYDNVFNFSKAMIKTTIVNKSTDFTGHIKLDNLTSDKAYYYRVWLSTLGKDNNNKNASLIGKFKTAPYELSNRTVKLIIGGDLGGAELCRRVDIGYSIFSVMKTLSPDFFIFNGDQIYADNSCPEKEVKKFNFAPWYNVPGGDVPSVSNTSQVKVNWKNLTQLREVYVKHWEYNRADPHLQKFLQSTSMYSQADDHEVINDYGGQWEYYWTKKFENTEGYRNLVDTGIDVFFNFSPIERNRDEPDRIYRSFNWGKYLDLFLLDAHSYRSRSDLPDTPQNNKTLYGKEQLRWLVDGLLNSTSVWKVISTPVPITIPNCFAIKDGLGCDNWATNTSDTSIVNQTYIRERVEFLKLLDKENIKNVVFIATDVHFAANVHVEQDFDGDGDMLIFYEMASGPLSTNTRDEPNKPDPTINTKSLYSEAAIFDFGYLKVEERRDDKKVHLFYNVIDENNRIRPGSSLNLIPQ